MTQRIREAAYTALGISLLAYAVVNWFATVRDLRRFYTNMWIWDPWDYLSHFDRYKHFDLSVLWIQHNEHREIGTEISYIVDIALFHGRQIVPEFLGIAAYMGVLLIFIACAWFSTRNIQTVCAAFLATAIAGYKICVVSLNVPFLTSWPQWEFFAAASLAAIVLHRKRTGNFFLVAAIVLAIAATYSMSNGMLVWPLLIAAGLLLRLSRRQITVIALTAAASIGLYFVQYKNLHSLDLGTALHHPAYVALFLGSFLGMPFGAAYHNSNPAYPTVLFGWFALMLAVVDFAWIIKQKLYTSAPAIVMGGYCLLTIASSTLTAFGRMNPSDPLFIAARAGRYITEPTLFWCALILLSVWLWGKASNGYAAFVFLLSAGIISARTLPKSQPFYGWWQEYFQRGQWAAIGLANGVTESAIGDVLFPSREYLAEFKHVLIDNRLSVFAGPEPGWVGHPWNWTFTRGPDSYIHGQVTTVKKMGADFEVQGWADGVTRVVFIDDSGRIIGFGMRPKAGPAELYTHDVPKALAFTGFIRGAFGAHQFSAWAVDRRGQKIFRLGRLQNSIPE